MIYLQVSKSVTCPVKPQLFKKAAQATLDHQASSPPIPANLTIVLTDDEHIRTLNRDFLGIDAPTDVLAFPAEVTDPETQSLYLGDVLISEIGGSMGPLYGTLFLEMAEAGKGAARVDAEVFLRMLDRATSAVRDVSGAQLGDKTILDALVPALDAYRASVAANAGFAAALGAMRAAAQRGMESTRDMVARVGRSSRLGERSRGTLDAGAASCALLLGVMADTLTELSSRAN